MSTVALAVQLDHADERARAWPELLELCRALCAWELPPTGWMGGRAARHVVPSDLAAATGIRTLKFKGLGVAPQDGAPAAPPTGDPYDRWPGQDPDPHFGIGPDTEFRLLTGDPAPYGGLLLDAARRELACAAALERHGAATVLPIASFAFVDRDFTVAGVPRRLGVAVTGSATTDDERCSATLPGWPLPAHRRGPEGERLRRVLGVPASADPVAGDLRVLAAAYRAFGSSLRAFADAGWYRYSGHADNFSIDAAGRAVLVDLDSCRPLDPARPDLAALEHVRDGMSALYNLACAFFRPAVLDATTDDHVLDAEPFSAFLDGWDPGSTGRNGAAGRAIARYVIASRRQLRHFGGFLRSDDPAAEHLYRHVRHDRDLTFVWLYRLLFARRVARPAGLPMPFSVDELDARILRFAGRPRMEHLMQLERVVDAEGEDRDG